MALAELHLHEGVGEGAEPHAAMFDGDEGQPETLRAGLLAQVREHGLVGLAGGHFLFGGDAFFLHPLAHALADFLGVVRNGEIDGHCHLLPVFLALRLRR